MLMEQTVIIGEGGRKARYTGQGKMNFGQGKVSKNFSWNFVSDLEWTPV